MKGINPESLTQEAAYQKVARQEKIWNNIRKERDRQDQKWGDANSRHLPVTTWMVILMEEVGETSEAILKKTYIETELIHVGAVVVAMLESLKEAPLGIEEEDAG